MSHDDKVSRTPRTDAFAEDIPPNASRHTRDHYEWREFSRQLERELAEVQSVAKEVSAFALRRDATATVQSATRDTIIEECAKVCDETAQFQSEMALNTNTEESMVTYRKARAWDASVCAAKIRALKRHDDIHDVERKP